ncbi:MAG: Elongation factor P [candidate division TA06 bacterium ADurb.Bin131]|uniref:Elongation factor P n=1 Tax=candidate division TA06 bacterium ADurb.Bin131 TaxID=1852827 RepID=A0A1V6C790_UNCT6|nr:MAG: Elongation factor P [candidate division TA06 bacterium ADurb.Bin131]
MIDASNVKVGSFIKKDNEIFQIIEIETKAGPARFSNYIHIKIKNLKTNKILEMKLMPEEKLENLDLQHIYLEYLYSDGENLCFMNPQTYEQFEIPQHMIGNFKDFLKEGTKVRFEIYEDTPVNVIIPETVELKVISTGSGVKGETDTTYKNAVLENNMEILVPHFIKEGDIIKVSTSTKHYVERVHK